MRMVDIIARKRDGKELTEREIRFFVQGYTAGSIPEYQAAALLMAIYLRGMTTAETTFLTLAMAQSGDCVDLSPIPGIKVDKHSTGGVGDKTTLVVAPLVAALGVPVAKMSGRGLGHTGGTIDKLEAIPGFRTTLTREEWLANVQTIGISLAGQTGDLAPADKKLYALRDATSTVASLPLIASSVMSKKLASGADAVVLDVKTGSGAFMEHVQEAATLAREMVRIGQNAGRRMVALITNMDTPLGRCIGNALEVTEAIQTLRGHGPEDLTQLCTELAANMLWCAGKGDLPHCRAAVAQSLASGCAYEKFLELVAAQGGDTRYVQQPDMLSFAPLVREVYAPQDGFITHMHCAQIGTASMLLGAGRTDKDSPIDYGAGIVLYSKTGAHVRQGEPLARLYTSDLAALPGAEEAFLQAVHIGSQPPAPKPLVYERIVQDDATGKEFTYAGT